MQTQKNKICAVIITGGLSSRMGGGIKSFEQFNKKNIFDRIIERIVPQTKYIIINSNEKNNKFYDYNLPIVKDKITGHLGPLAGIHASLDWIKFNIPETKWLVSVPCDTPFFPNNLIKKLLLKANKSNKNIILAKSNNRIHPVIGLWKTNLLEDLEENLKNGTRKIMMWVNHHSFDTQVFDDDPFDPFFNINFKDDLIQAKKIEDKYII
tara:strand:- start:3621 stop:4247 length:627 start_codon:yes stop_codon:yes gene_type:complete